MNLVTRISLGLVLVASLASTAFAAGPKSDERVEKQWSPLPESIQQLLSDVAEAEPNNSLATAQLLSCGNVLRPASIGAASDTDYVYFTANAGDVITVGTDADGTTGQVGDTRIRVFNNSGVVLASDDDSGPGLYSLLTFTASYTGTYYVGFAAFSATGTGGYKGFITCTTPQPPPVNDICQGAIPIPCGPIDLAGSTQFATNDYTPLASGSGGCTGFTALGRDVVYLINVAAGDVLDAFYTSSADASIYVITDCSQPTTTCIGGADATLSGQAEHLTVTFPSAGLYYLILDSFGTNTSGTWTLTGTLTCYVVPTARTSWGRLKTIYR